MELQEEQEEMRSLSIVPKYLQCFLAIFFLSIILEMHLSLICN